MAYPCLCSLPLRPFRLVLWQVSSLMFYWHLSVFQRCSWLFFLFIAAPTIQPVSHASHKHVWETPRNQDEGLSNARKSRLMAQSFTLLENTLKEHPVLSWVEKPGTECDHVKEWIRSIQLLLLAFKKSLLDILRVSWCLFVWYVFFFTFSKVGICEYLCPYLSIPFNCETNKANTSKCRLLFCFFGSKTSQCRIEVRKRLVSLN